MQTPLQVTVRNAALGEGTRRRVEHYVAKLETFCSRITACRVTIEIPQRFPAGSPVAYDVRVDVRVPGEAIVIGRQQHPELETAIQNAFRAAGRRLQDYARRMRGDVKRHGELEGVTTTQS